MKQQPDTLLELPRLWPCGDGITIDVLLEKQAAWPPVDTTVRNSCNATTTPEKNLDVIFLRNLL